MGAELARAARLAVPLALLIVLVNPLVYREGETLLIRGGEVLGYRIEITLEALAYGGAAGAAAVRAGDSRSRSSRRASIPTTCSGSCGACRTAAR